ncbi:Nickel-dependent lactate racemase [Caloramator quimbayensis]|uniref:Nickel-dependent lactate racemase n=1 Tax=Caloramator quimbayensis TaxID=1147123 RepID=A0A1T4XNR5_9CLOT|nr:nickel-dependent lactate racemase [Caloramator quimbayensis]SKA91220.1 Nickel-dependent lactate racemase [Caloramator quimbayensis]
MEFSLGFSKTTMKVNVDEKNLLGVLHANEVEIGLTGADEVKRSIENPINSKRLCEIIKKGEKIAIITSDITRPMPSKIVLPFVLEELKKAGVQDEDITIVFALGSHRKHTEDEKKYLVGEEIYKRIKCVDSDVKDYVHFGYTKNNTPINIFRAVAEADRRICLGNIEYHYFAGYSGGAKAIMPGVSTREAIQANHSRMVDEKAHAGNIETNPVRQDIEETVKFVPIDFIVNVVLDEKKNIIKCVSGHYIDAHREGCHFLDSFYKIKIKEKADIVITSPGGFPKDINLYQAQKALDNAKHAVKKNGIIILVASCREGLGEHTFEEWLLNAEKSQDLIERVKKDFKLGGHKAAAIAMVLQNARVFLVSELEPDFVKSIFLEPYSDAQSAYESALAEIGSDAKVLIIPHGGSILPCV